MGTAIELPILLTMRKFERDDIISLGENVYSPALSLVSLCGT